MSWVSVILAEKAASPAGRPIPRHWEKRFCKPPSQKNKASTGQKLWQILGHKINVAWCQSGWKELEIAFIPHLENSFSGRLLRKGDILEMLSHSVLTFHLMSTFIFVLKWYFSVPNCLLKGRLTNISTDVSKDVVVWGSFPKQTSNLLFFSNQSYYMIRFNLKA